MFFFWGFFAMFIFADKQTSDVKDLLDTPDYYGLKT